MKKIMNKTYGLALGFIKAFSLVLTGLLLICAFLFTCYADDMDSQLVLTKWDCIPGSLFLLILVPMLLLPISRLIARNPLRCRKILLAVVLGWYGLAGMSLVLFSKTAPTSDSMSVYSIAEALTDGNTGVIHPTDSYLSYYPQQIGLVAYYEAAIRLWKQLPIDYPAYHILKCLNIGWVWVIILFQYKTVRLLFRDYIADSIYLLFSLCNLPLLLYTSFIYGEIPSFALFSLGLWALLTLLNDQRTPFSASAPRERSIPRLLLLAGLSVLSFAGAVALRKNTLILMIAVILVLVFECLSNGRACLSPSSAPDAPPPTRPKKTTLLLLASLYLVVSLTVLPLIQVLYEQRAGNRLSSGVPAMSYFAMGMQESSRANGWYNGFNFNTYQQTGMNTEATISISRKAIRQRLTYFRENPGYAAGFYGGKFLSQWADGTYASRQATIGTFGGRSDFFNRLYEGDLSPFFISFCNGIQNLLYLGAFLFCFAAQPRLDRGKVLSLPATDGLLLWLCLIGVIGGFLFHTIWEANSRYILPYGMLLLPYASEGLSLLTRKMENDTK